MVENVVDAFENDEEYVLDDYDEKIAQDIFKDKIDFPIKDISLRKYDKLNLELNDDWYTGSNKGKIKYEKGILRFDGYSIYDINDILKIFNTFVECLTEHGEYLKRYLQKKSELEEKLGFLNEEDTNVDENKTNDLF